MMTLHLMHHNFVQSVLYLYSGTTSPERKGEQYRKQKKYFDDNLKPKLNRYKERRYKAQRQFNDYAAKDETYQSPPSRGNLLIYIISYCWLGC